MLFRSPKRDGGGALWEHQYLRILDVPAVLEAREYCADGEVVFDVSDPYGYAAGRWHLTVRDGVGRVVPAGEDSQVPTVALGGAELSAMYLGGVAPSLLGRAGRVERSQSDQQALDRLLRAGHAPFLSIWY